MSKIDGVDIKALCDIRLEKANTAKALLENTGHKPDVYSGSENEWKRVCERKDIDLIYIATPWKLHTPMAVYAMEHGKHAASEVPAAVTLDECWQLVETSEKTKQHCMILENCCYDFFELMTLNMAQTRILRRDRARGRCIHSPLAGQQFLQDKLLRHVEVEGEHAERKPLTHSTG
jgi:hypothetical protein